MALKKTDDVKKQKSFNEVNEELDNEELRKDLNPNYTDEDGVVHDVELLAGIEYEGQLLKTFSYREMNGRDEEAINKAEVRQNTGKLVNVLLERTVVDVGGITKKELGAKKFGDLIRSMYGSDLDYMMLQVRKISKGSVISFEHQCPNCRAKVITEKDIDEMEIIPFNGQYEIPFELPRGYKDAKGVVHTTGTLRLITGLDREIVFPVLKKNQASGFTTLLTRIMKFDDGAIIFNQNVADMSLRDRDYLQDLLTENKFGVDSNFEVECPNCGEDLTGTIGQADFF